MVTWETIRHWGDEDWTGECIVETAPSDALYHEASLPECMDVVEAVLRAPKQQAEKRSDEMDVFICGMPPLRGRA